MHPIFWAVAIWLGVNALFLLAAFVRAWMVDGRWW